MSQRIRKSPGSIHKWSQRFARLAEGNADSMSVPCGTCNACCRIPSLVVDLAPGEEAEFPEAIWCDGAGRFELPKRPGGECIHLVDGRCSIYDRRPRSCRTFDCRRYLVGIIPTAEGQSTFAKDVLGWWGEWEIKSPKDVDAMFAWHRAFKEVSQYAISHPMDAMAIIASVFANFLRLRPGAGAVRRLLGFKDAKDLGIQQDRHFREVLSHQYDAKWVSEEEHPAHAKPQPKPTTPRKSVTRSRNKIPLRAPSPRWTAPRRVHGNRAAQKAAQAAQTGRMSMW